MVEGLPEDLSYLECGLPDWLYESIETFNKSVKEKSLSVDCFFCELQSDINVAEVEQLITPNQANYLRCKYLYDEEFEYQ